MHFKIVGAILLVGAGLVAACGTISAELANGMVLAAFYMAKMGGAVPPAPNEAGPQGVVYVMTALLTVCGLYFLFIEKTPK